MWENPKEWQCYQPNSFLIFRVALAPLIFMSPVPLLRSDLRRLHGLVQERIFQLFLALRGAMWGTLLLLYQRDRHSVGTRQYYVWLWGAELPGESSLVVQVDDDRWR